MILHLNFSNQYLFTYEVIMHLYMLSSHMKDRTLCQSITDWLSLYNHIGLSTCWWGSFNSYINHVLSWAAIIVALYLAFLIDKDTVGCLLLHHDSTLDPRLNSYLVVKCLMSWSLIKSTPQWPTTSHDAHFLYKSPNWKFLQHTWVCV